MQIFYIFCLLLLCNRVSAQVVYKTVKADGSVVYSDVNSQGAVPIKLLSINTVVVPVLNKTSSQTFSKTTNQNNHIKKVKFEVQYLVSILSPEAEQTLRDNAGAVTVSASVLPKKVGKFQLIFDGQIFKTQTKNQFQLRNVNRGAHTIKVNFLDNSGKILASSS